MLDRSSVRVARALDTMATYDEPPLQAPSIGVCSTDTKTRDGATAS